MKTILITGGAGFIGSHLVEYMLDKHADYNIINLDALTYAGDITRLDAVNNNERYKFCHGNICDISLLDDLFANHHITDIIHLAAESHVDNSINNPSVFIETNIVGTFNLLQAAKKHWNNKKQENRFLHVSTDEVYGSLGEVGYFTENTPYAPNSPYSASKASSDFLVRSYFHTYDLPVLISNCSNNYGPRQHSEKLIPTIIRTALAGNPIPIYGNGKNIRDWLYVLDHCSALDTILHNGVIGESYNIGTNNEKTNIEIVTAITDILDECKPLALGVSYKAQVTYVTDRCGHDYRYAIDNTKITSKLGWASSFSFVDSLKSTVLSYI